MKLSKTVMFGWLQESTPQERSELSILRLLRKLENCDMECINQRSFLKELTAIPSDLKEDYMNKKITLKDIKQKLKQERNKTLGIKAEDPFEQIDREDIEWLRLVTGELDIYRWKNKKCSLCGLGLSTSHVVSCKGTENLRKEIEILSELEAQCVIKNPPLLNKLPKLKRNKIKSTITDKINLMIRSAG